MGSPLAILALFLPGLAWWTWLGDSEDDAGQALAKALGFSIALTALATMLLGALKMSILPAGLAVYLILATAFCLAGFLHRGSSIRKQGWFWALLGFAILLVWRVWQARSLVLPNWTDSLHHTLIVRKIMEANTLPRDLLPYLPNPFYYHYAFHAFAAFFGKLSGLDPAQAVLITGQLLMAGASMAVYAFTRGICRNTIAAIIAAVISAFVLRMPGYYLTWGRYTLLTGMLMLPLVMDEALAALAGRRKFLQAASLGLLFAGAILAHYFMVVLLAFFFALAFLNWFVSSISSRSWRWSAILSFLLPLVLASGALLPWFFRVRRLALGVVNTEPLRILNVDRAAQWPYLGQLLGPGLGVTLAILAILGALYCLTKTELRSFGLWSLVLGFLCLPTGLHLITFRSDYFTMALYFPVSVSLAVLAAATDQFLSLRHMLPDQLTAFGQAGFLVLVFTAALQNADPINAQTVLVNKADLNALQWVRSHVPPEARFFVNTTPWSWEYYRGVDGGAWLLPYTGNWSLAPTIFYGQTQDRAMVDLWMDWGMRASKVSDCGTDFWELVEEADLSYVYASLGRGHLQPQVLDQCEGLERLYGSEGVGVWLIKSMP